MAHPGVKDPYREKARKEGYPARSIFKLKEIQQRYQLIKRGYRVVDLGCHPGSWLLFCSQTVGPEGKVLGIDLKAPTTPPAANVAFLEADVSALAPDRLPGWARQVDAVLSDLAPHTSGIKWLDHQRSLDLARRAMEIAVWILKPGGALLVKIFQGPETETFRRELASRFGRVEIEKPRSSRQESREVYLVGRDFKKRNDPGH